MTVPPTDTTINMTPQDSTKIADPGYDTWLVKAQAFADWVSANGRLPRMSGVEDDSVERAFGTWMKRMRELRSLKRHSSAAQEPRFAWLDANVLGWFDSGARPAGRKLKSTRTHEGTVKAVAAFQRKHGRLPRIGGTLNQESRLGKFLANQRQVAARGVMPKPNRSRLDRLVPEWHLTPTRVALAA